MHFTSKTLYGLILFLTIPFSAVAVEVSTLNELHQALAAANNGHHKEILN
ncbi:hypothetical protein [uncultured Pseudodesulfovibrio sp.]|nr:hypothetical protein [uncultured Pseudodesulfovibrio sp.]